MAWILYSPGLPVSDFAEYQRLGQGIVAGEGFSINGQPTAYRPPGYPLFLAGVISIAGNSLLPMQISQALLGVLSVWLLACIGVRIFNHKVALVGAFFVAGFPSLIAYTAVLASENLAMPLLLLALLCFLIFAETGRVVMAAIAGVLVGATGLVRPEVLILPAAWLAVLIFGWRRRSIPIQYTLGAFVFILAITLSLLPWTVRNQLVLGHTAPISSNGGIIMLASFNPQSSDPEKNALALDKVFQLSNQNGWDEFESSRYAFSLAKDNIQRDRWQIIKLAPIKLYYLLRDDVSGISWNFKLTSRPVEASGILVLKALAQVYYMVVLLLAVGAAVTHPYLHPFPLHRYLIASILAWVLFFSIFIATDRYHILILPFLALYGAFTCVRLLRRLAILR